MPNVAIQVVRLDEAAVLPTYAHPGDAGCDLVSIEQLTLKPGNRALVRTGIAIAIPEGYVGLVNPRSGIATKHGVTVVNAPGTIDSGYRGEIRVGLINLDRETPFEIEVGMRIAQLVLVPVISANFIQVANLDDSVRGTDGFGSTGIHG